MTKTTQTYILELTGEPGAVVRLLRALLKVLGRVHGVKCKSVEPVDA